MPSAPSTDFTCGKVFSFCNGCTKQTALMLITYRPIDAICYSVAASSVSVPAHYW
jgi:hypothetical protein